ncbi:ADP-ribose pyrophosphatase [bacterium HR34]|nr:ADP-ribose pyrophosphatase [bacterium HR34]
MKIEKFKLLKKERLFDGFNKIDAYTFLLPNGKTKTFQIKTLDRDIAAIVAFTKDKKIILEKQYRIGPGKIVFEFPSGIIEKNEKPIEGAKRELLEETGYTGKFKKLFSYYDDSYDRIKTHLFIATDCEKVRNKLKLDDGEFIKTYLKDIKEVRKMLKEGKIRNFGVGYLAFDYLNLL